MITKHPTNCDCEFEFPHSLIITSRIVGTHDNRTEERTTFVVCRACMHWIGAKPERCRCAFECHSIPGGTRVDSMALSAVDLG